MDDTTRVGYDGGNRLIDGLSPVDRAEIVAHLTVMTADESSGGITRGARITAAYFPIDAVFSVLAELSRGDCYEVDSVGRGGLIGAELLLGADFAARSVICQIEGRFAQMPREAFQEGVARMPAFASAVHHALLLQWHRAQQTIACNFAHSPLERCARWTLLTHDAVGRAEFSFRAEYLAMMLGLQPHAVAEPMAALQAIGAVRYTDDVVTVVSERRLLEAACECYTAPVDLGRRLALARPRAERDAQ